MSGSIWERFTHDPREEQHALLRAADRDRDVVNDILSTAYAEGRLTPEELDERTDQVANARTLGELPAVMSDLVPTLAVAKQPVTERRVEAERRYRQMRQQALYGFLTPTLICWVIWLSLLWAGGGTNFPWPVFVTIGTGMRFLQLSTNKEDTIVAIEREMDKRERKKLEAQRRKELGQRPADDDAADHNDRG
jgi:hypothetical protein